MVSLNNLALLYVQMNKANDASKNFETAIDILEEKLREKHKMLIPFLENYADFLDKQNFNVEASAIRKRIKIIENQ